MKTKALINKQQGVITLLTAVILLICITLVVLLTVKTVMVETQVTADNYRSSQAYGAANAAMDHAVAYFYAGGLDQHNNATPATATPDGLVDYTGPGAEPSTAACATPAASTENILTLSSGAQTTFAQYYYDNTPGNACDCVAGNCLATTNMTMGMITAKGWSDDCQAVRTITQCVGTFSPFSTGDGPQQPFVGRAGVGAFGNATIINRYNNTSIWTGGPDAVHGAAFGTYLRPSGTDVGDYTAGYAAGQLSDPNSATNTQLVSNRNAGNGVDIITNDNTLANLTSTSANLTDPAQNTFFGDFFSVTKAEIQTAADSTGQYYSPTSPNGTAPASGTTGLVWVDTPGGMNLNGGTLGSPTSPVILIVNGDLKLTGTPTIYGTIYVTGQLSIAGTPTVYGSVIDENSQPSTGAGTLTLVYTPWGGGGSNPPFIPGTGAIIAGSWKDW